LVAPNFVLPFCLFYGAPLFIAWPIVWAAVAKQKVETEMRRLAGPRFGLGANTAGWVSRQGPLPSLVGPGNEASTPVGGRPILRLKVRELPCFPPQNRLSVGL